MDKPDSPESLTAAECAARTGLTVRALRVYEEYGLISPRRSPGGWRLYGPEDLVKLNTIMVLKTAGLSLTQIGEVTRAGSLAPSLREILEIQLETWKLRQADAARGQAVVETALQRLAILECLSLDDLCNLIRSLEMNPEPPPNSQAGHETDEVHLDASVLDRYVGTYAPDGGEFGLYTITRVEHKLIFQATGQPSLDLVPASDTEFLMPVVDAQISFQVNEGNLAAALVLRQHGVEVTGVKVDTAEAERMKAHLAERIEQKVAVPGSAEALRWLAEGIQAGRLDYDRISPALAQVMRKQLPRLQLLSSYLGAITSVEFEGVGGQGWDVYKVQRERGAAQWRIALRSDGVIVGALATLTSPMTVGP